MSSAVYHSLNQHDPSFDEDGNGLEVNAKLKEDNGSGLSHHEADDLQRQTPPAKRSTGKILRRLQYVPGVLILGGSLVFNLIWAHRADVVAHTSTAYKDHTAATYWPTQKWEPMADSVYQHFAPMDQDLTKGDRACAGWVPGTDKGAANCWRAKRYDQLEALLAGDLTKHMDWGGAPQYDNVAALVRLKDCLGDIQGTLNCPKHVFKVLAGQYHYFCEGLKEMSMPSGELIWTTSYIKLMKQHGFTLLGVHGYDNMVKLHRAIPDVITMWWANDAEVMTCQNDPRCVTDMRPTQEMYPDFPMYRNRPVWGFQSDDGRPGYRWIWTQEELDALPEAERGVIPPHKLFVASVWGSRPGNEYFHTPTNQELTYNNLGHAWTVSSFQYPGHTYMPFSVQFTCMNKSDPQHVKEDRLFVLGKSAEFFYEPHAPPIESWRDIIEGTGLSITSAAAEGDGKHHWEIPDGVETMGHLSKVDFAAAMGKSRAMLAIGRPTISPSPYEALCQGTPVLMPYYRNKSADPWEIFSAAYSQHGPAIELGEPYVYAYRGGDVADLIRQAKKAAATPIEKYIPTEMTIDSLSHRILWYMYFDWEALATAIDASKDRQYSVTQAYVMGRCFDWRRCIPFGFGKKS